MSDEEISRIVHGGEFRFEEAVSYFDKKVPVTAGVFYDLADHYRALAFTVSTRKPRSSKNFMTSCWTPWKTGPPWSSSGSP